MPRLPSGVFRRKDGMYVCRITVDGKLKSFYSTSPKEARKKADEYSTCIEAGSNFEKIAEEWYLQKINTIRYGTQRTYAPAYKRAVAFFSGLPIKEITSSQINNFILAFANQGYAQKTVSNQLSVLNMIFLYAIAQGHLRDNPAQYVRVPSNLPKEKREPPTEIQINAIKQGVSNPFGLFPFFLLYTGMRCGEALAIQYKDIHANSINITKQVVHHGNKPVIEDVKTENGVRDIPLLDILKQVLPSGPPDDYLFGGESPLTRSALEKRWVAWSRSVDMAHSAKRLAKKRNGKEYLVTEWKSDISRHQLRHEFTSLLFEAGVDEKVAQTIIGHADIQTTRNIYQHIKSRQTDEAMIKLNTLIKNNN